RRRYQTQIKLPTGNCWVAFRPSSPNGRDQYFFQYVARINAAGWRPEGTFPNGINMSGIDLSEVEIKTETRTARSGLSSMCFQYAYLSEARFSGSSFFGV